MRFELLYKPSILLERLALEANRRGRLAKLKGTVGAGLSRGHIDSLELLQLLQAQQPRVIYDIGANIGTWSLLARAIYPQSEIQAFEPLPMHQQGFVKNTSNLRDIHLHSVALGSRRHQATMRITNLPDASSLLDPTQESMKHFNVRKTGEQAVEVATLDEYRAQNELSFADLIKLDVQGFELEVLRGATECLTHAKAIITEVSFVEFYKNQALFHDVDSFLNDHNFQLYALGVNTPLGEPLAQTDALFVKNATSQDSSR